jgi:hypothetical protein
MFRSKILLKTTFFTIFVLAAALTANAQATRTWVSGVGDDVNPCSRTAPCKTFAGAISKTATNGEISCLDPGGFGAVTITKSITIDCEDTQGSILAAGTNGIIINITAVADTKKSVKIRGISINGAATGINGIRVLAVNSLVVEECVMDGFTQHGISIETTTGTPKVAVDATGIRSNAGNGINSFITGGSVTLSISNSRINNNVSGVNMASNTKATVSHSQIVENTTGVVAANGSTVGILACSVSLNTTGISSLVGGGIRVMGTMVTGNGTGIAFSGGGTLISHTSNMFAGNTIDGTPSSSVALQ